MAGYLRYTATTLASGCPVKWNRLCHPVGEKANEELIDLFDRQILMSLLRLAESPQMLTGRLKTKTEQIKAKQNKAKQSKTKRSKEKNKTKQGKVQTRQNKKQKEKKRKAKKRKERERKKKRKEKRTSLYFTQNCT